MSVGRSVSSQVQRSGGLLTSSKEGQTPQPGQAECRREEPRWSSAMTGPREPNSRRGAGPEAESGLHRALGTGRSALLLKRRGTDTHAWSVRAQARGAEVEQCRDVTQGLQLPLGDRAGVRVQANQGTVDWSLLSTTLMQKNRNSQHPEGPPSKPSRCRTAAERRKKNTQEEQTTKYQET